ncbi:MAG: TetR/AcrR family transcriptional regulator [Thioalkalispiraceae bacterium]|jgi:AcrR family transcriptional regulator
MVTDKQLRELIVDTAVELAEQSSWEHLYLHQIADALGISLEQLHEHFTVKDELVEAWYDRADSAMLQVTEGEEFHSLTYRERLHALIMAWLDYLARHKTVSRDMLLYKLEPAHLHLQILGLLRVSRTVQWLREAARLDSTHLQRIVEETGLTGIYLNTFVYWMFDSSEYQTNTRRFLDKRLVQAEKVSNLFFLHKPVSGPYPETEQANAR